MVNLRLDNLSLVEEFSFPRLLRSSGVCSGVGSCLDQEGVRSVCPDFGGALFFPLEFFRRDLLSLVKFPFMLTMSWRCVLFMVVSD